MEGMEATSKNKLLHVASLCRRSWTQSFIFRAEGVWRTYACRRAYHPVHTLPRRVQAYAGVEARHQHFPDGLMKGVSYTEPYSMARVIFFSYLL